MILINQVFNKTINFFINGSFISLAGILAGLLNFSFNIYFARSLSNSNYLILSLIISFLALSMFIGDTSKKYIIREAQSKDFISDKNFSGILYYLTKINLLFFFILILIIFFNSSFFSKILKVNDLYFYILIVFNFIFMVFFNMLLGILVSQEKYKIYSSLTLVNIGLKLILGIIFFLVDPKLVSVIFALLASSFLSVCITLFFCNKYIFGLPKKFYKSNTKFYCKVALNLSAYFMIFHGDILLVSYYTSTDFASTYAACSSISKVVVYLLGGYIEVFYVEASKNYFEKKKSNTTFFLIIFLFSIILFLLFLVFYFFANDINQILYNGKFNNFSELLPLTLIILSPISLILTIEHFLISKNNILLSLTILFSLPICIFLIGEFTLQYYDILKLMFLYLCILFLFGLSLMINILRKN